MEEKTYPQTWYVYTYAYPDGRIFYVGKGTHGRISAHETEARRGCQCNKCQVICGIWANGHPVQKRIVFETMDENKALEHETKLIKQYDNLVNVIVPVDVSPDVNEEPETRHKECPRLYVSTYNSSEGVFFSIGMRHDADGSEHVITHAIKAGANVTCEHGKNAEGNPYVSFSFVS